VKRNSFRLIIAWILTAVAAANLSAGASGPKAEVRITGLGWLENRLARRTLGALLGDKPRATLDANAIEDSALVLFSQLTDEGYLRPELNVKITLADGRTTTYPVDAHLEHPLPRPLEARAVTFEVRRGPRFVLQEITFTGLAALSPEKARTFFVGEGMLISLDSERIYSPGRLQRSVTSLEAELRQRGYAEATVASDHLVVDEVTGKAQVNIVVNEGPLWQVTALRFDVADGGEPPSLVEMGRTGRPWSSLWRQDLLTAIRRWYYERGHPDVQVQITPDAAPAVAGSRAVAVVAAITPGSKVQVGQVRFLGNAHTKTSILTPLVPVKTGEPLDPAKFDDGQSRLLRLGVFNRVELAYEPPDGDTRDAVYRVTEGRRQEVSLLAGYGSYEQLRGGIEWKHYNLFGRAFSDDLELIQSMKSTQGSYTFSVPELFGSTVDGSARIFGLRREELAFLREEYGANASLLWPLPGLGASLTTGYTLQNLGNTDNELASSSVDTSRTTSASLDLGLTRDKRDSPLEPHHGYKLALRAELAAKALGGDVDYQQAIFTASWHTPWGHSRWLHLGFAQGVVTTMGAPEGSQPPVNVLFYPGGDGSIRGYQKDEAAPRSPTTGQFVGAKTYTQINVELEQALTRKWTAVAFFDGVGTAVRLEDYPASEKLYSVGLGVRYQTVVGPVRLEYGHNLNPRPFDPSGTVLFSVGFPF
jgi:outer membrane protein insertion porin family